MKNQLELFIETHGLDEAEVMNLLQWKGIISDNCVLANEVAEENIPAAIAYVKETRHVILNCFFTKSSQIKPV